MIIYLVHEPLERYNDNIIEMTTSLKRAKEVQKLYNKYILKTNRNIKGFSTAWISKRKVTEGDGDGQLWVANFIRDKENENLISEIEIEPVFGSFRNIRTHEFSWGFEVFVRAKDIETATEEAKKKVKRKGVQFD